MWDEEEFVECSTLMENLVEEISHKNSNLKGDAGEMLEILPFLLRNHKFYLSRLSSSYRLRNMNGIPLINIFYPKKNMNKFRFMGIFVKAEGERGRPEEKKL